MNVALKLAQFEYDNRLPVVIDDSAEREWVANGVELLRMGADVQYGVTYERFAVAVDEFAMDQLGQAGISQSVLGRLILRVKYGSPADARTAADELLLSADPDKALREIAEALLEPFADDALLAKAEDDAL